MKKIFILFSLVFTFTLCQGQYAGFVAGNNAVIGPYSAELITDGDFNLEANHDWALTGGWTYNTTTHTMDFDDATNGNLVQPDGYMVTSIEPNTTYKLEFDIDIVGGGNANFCIKTTSGETWVDYADYADDHHNFEIGPLADIGAGGFYIRADENNCDAAFSIDNISLKKKY